MEFCTISLYLYGENMRKMKQAWLRLCGLGKVITFLGPRVQAAGAVMAPATHTQYSHSHDRQSALLEGPCTSVVLRLFSCWPKLPDRRPNALRCRPKHRRLRTRRRVSRRTVEASHFSVARPLRNE